MRYTIGLDLGVNNVGWSIYNNEANKIEKSGVRLFNPSDDASNRRVNRNTRRRRKRKDNRIDDLLKELKQVGFPNDLSIDQNLIEKRYVGIRKQLTKQDITNILCYFMNHRGYIPYGDEEVNPLNLEGKLPCEYYYHTYLEKGRYHGSDLPTVKLEDNIREVTALFDEQKKYYPELEKIKESVINILKRKRAFWEGPGSTKSLTPFGRFKTQEDVIEYENNKKENTGFEKYIFEDLIGKCEIAINEKCAPKANYYAEVFNLLNDFINVNIKNIEDLANQDNFIETNGMYKFSSKALDKIIDYCKNNNTIRYESLFKNLFGLKIEQLEGYRIDKDKKPEFSTLESYRTVKKSLEEKNCSLDWLDDCEIYNRVIYNMAIAPGTVEFVKMLCADTIINNEYKFNENELNALKDIYLKLKKKSVLGYHSLSEKVLVRAINDMKTNQMNFMQVRRKFDYDKEAREFFAKNYSHSLEGMPHLNDKYIDDIIASPQVKKTLRQSIKVINAIINEKKCLPEVIAIESTKEMNGKDKKLEIDKEQRIKEKLKKEARDTIINYFGIEKLNEKNIEKVMLYQEIDGECPYCGRTKIKLEDVIENRIEVEHILPISKSSDDSFNNKTISCTNCNQDKGNRTPYEFLTARGEYEDFKKRIKALKNMNEEKKEHLLFEGTIDKYTTRFFNRNLRDTAYATSELVNQINLFNYYLKETYENEKILTLSTPGQLTHKIRDELTIDKDRDDGRYHHAVDASIVASIANTDIGKLIIDSQNNPKFWLNNKDKVFIKIPNLLENFNLGNITNQLKDIDSDDKIFISSQILKNPQKQLANANMYKIIKKDNSYYKIEQINNIYELNLKDKSTATLLETLFNEDDNKKTLLCYDNDKELFNRLKEIYLKYKNDDGNPFVNYILDSEGLEKGFDVFENIEKYGIKVSSKTNSPIVKRLRYYSVISTPFLLEKNNIKKKENTFIALDSLAQTCTEVYVDIEANKFAFLPIYSVSMDLKNNKVNKDDRYYKELYEKYIGNKKVRYITTLYNGMLIEVQKRNGEIIVGEYQYFDKTNNKVKLKSNDSLTMNDFSLTIYDVDVLGNKKIRLTETLK